MKIKFNYNVNLDKQYGQTYFYEKDEVADVDPITARDLINSGAAKQLTTPQYDKAILGPMDIK